MPVLWGLLGIIFLHFIVKIFAISRSRQCIRGIANAIITHCHFLCWIMVCEITRGLYLNGCASAASKRRITNGCSNQCRAIHFGGDIAHYSWVSQRYFSGANGTADYSDTV